MKRIERPEFTESGRDARGEIADVSRMITLGIDCGTQSTKTLALDTATGEVLALAARPYGLIEGLPDGAAEQDPAGWIAAVDATVAEVLEKLGPRRDEVRGLGVSGQQHGFVPLDDQGRVIRPAKLWCDTSTAGECELIRAHFGGAAAVIERVGLDMLPGFTAPKILWLKRHEPENFARLATVLLPHDYLNFYLTGKVTMEYGDASGTALMDVRRRAWSRDVCEFIDVALMDKLPELTSLAATNRAPTRPSAIPCSYGRTAPDFCRAVRHRFMSTALRGNQSKPGTQHMSRFQVSRRRRFASRGFGHLGDADDRIRHPGTPAAGSRGRSPRR